MPNDFQYKDLVRIAKRDNNIKRPYLLVNPQQGKHIPVSPIKALNLFHKLAQKLYAKYPDEKLLFIGFAETATAIGAAIACGAMQTTSYIHTTRENLGNVQYLFFSEAHSHAVEQKIVADHLESMISASDRIIFVEDEVTTGNTILNIIQVLNQAYPDYILRYGIVSILNSMEDARIEKLLKEDILCTYLIKLSPCNYRNILEHYSFAEKQDFIACTGGDVPHNIIIGGKLDSRIGVSNQDYLTQCKMFSESIRKTLTPDELKAKRILVLGTEEFMFPALIFASQIEKECGAEMVRFHASTRSPILSSNEKGYPLFSRYQLRSLYDKERITYIYNLEKYDVVFVLHDASKPSDAGLCSLADALHQNHCKDIRFFQWESVLQSSYSPMDVTLLLKDISGQITPLSTQEREMKIQSGTHYSEMLPKEYRPSKEYLKAYHIALKNYAEPTAQAICRLSDKITARKGMQVVLVSLARAGIPIGILLKHDLEKRYHINVPHYSISIIRGRGIDHNALLYILQRHPATSIQFVDGWIGKGAIQNQLCKALKEYPNVDSTLAVVADPAYIGDLCGTHEDLLIPSSCLNSTVSGLISRTVLRSDLISKTDFHGAVFYKEYMDEDLSNAFIQEVEAYFKNGVLDTFEEVGTEGNIDVEHIRMDFGITDTNLIKPGIGETTRVLLRRLPWKVLIAQNTVQDPVISHLLRLASEKNVPVQVYPLRCYKTCGIIRNLADM